MQYKIITGMSHAYYDLIGYRMIESWLQYWPQDMLLTIYSEDIIDLDHPRIRWMDLNTIDPAYTEFQNIEKMKLASRAKTFAKKAWPIMKSLENTQGRLIWIDADVLTESYITQQWLDSLIDDRDFSSHIGVPQGHYYSVETGFFIINLSSPYRERFLDEYRRIYLDRDFSLMHKPYDGDAFGRVINTLRDDVGFRYKEFNPNYTQSSSPFNYVFEGYMKHYKAKRKNVFKDDHVIYNNDKNI